MSIKTTIAIVLIVVIAIGAEYYLTHPASPLVQTAPTPTFTHILAGQATSSASLVHGEDTNVYTIEVTYPAMVPLGDPIASAKAQTTLETALAKAITEFKSNSNLDTLTPDDISIQRLGGDHKYEQIIEYKQYAGDNKVSYLFTIFEDTLGAHPNTFFLTLTFDQQGNQLGIADVLKQNPNGLQDLSLLVSNDVVKQLKERTGQSDVTGVMFVEGVAPKGENFQNFVIDGNDLLIELPPYQVAAYAAGSFEVRIPLKNIVK